MECSCNEENLNLLIKYLKDDFKDLASIQY